MTPEQSLRHWTVILTAADRLLEAIDDRDHEAARLAAQRVTEECDRLEEREGT